MDSESSTSSTIAARSSPPKKLTASSSGVQAFFRTEVVAGLPRKNLVDLQLSSSGRAGFSSSTRSMASRLFLSTSSSESQDLERTTENTVTSRLSFCCFQIGLLRDGGGGGWCCCFFFFLFF